MNSYTVHFTVRGFLTTFAERVDAEQIDRSRIREILNQRLITEGFNTTVNEIFLIMDCHNPVPPLDQEGNPSTALKSTP